MIGALLTAFVIVALGMFGGWCLWGSSATEEEGDSSSPILPFDSCGWSGDVFTAYGESDIDIAPGMRIRVQPPKSQPIEMIVRQVDWSDHRSAVGWHAQEAEGYIRSMTWAEP